MIVRSVYYIFLHFTEQDFRYTNGLISSIFIFLLCFLAAILLLQKWRRFRSLPPGPWSLPYFGYRPLGDPSKAHHEVLSDLTENYGSIISVRKGSDLIVALRDPKDIRLVFRREELTGRPFSHISEILGDYGIINAEGQLWKEQRRFLHQSLRSLGMKVMTQGNMDTTITFEVSSFLQELFRQSGQNFDLTPALTTSVANVICSIIMNKRFEFCDSEFQRYMNLVDEGFMLAGKLISELKDIPIFNRSNRAKTTVDQLKKNHEEIGVFFKRIIDDHRNKFDRDNISDLVDHYLLEMGNCENKVLFGGRDPDRQLEQVMGDLFTAGMETVKTSIQWCTIFMLHHPDVQTKVQEEIDSVVGSRRLPTTKDLHQLPYTEATILEVLRHSSIVPLGTTHAATRDVEINGYVIPKDTHVIPLLHAVHHDPNLWEDPDRFDPTRFLNAHGKVVKPDYFIPFGVGRRMCLGDVLARMEIFQFFTSFLHTFQINLPEGSALPSLKGRVGITVSPEQFQVSLVPRKPSLICAEDTSAPTRNVGQN